jgi:hypothetical protein
MKKLHYDVLVNKETGNLVVIAYPSFHEAVKKVEYTEDTDSITIVLYRKFLQGPHKNDIGTWEVLGAL